IVDWNRKFGFESATDRLADPRVEVEVADVANYLRTVERRFDAILLDVDNGPEAWCLDSNKQLYDVPGLTRIRQALQLGGLLAVWSAEGSSAFEERLVAAGFSARSEDVNPRGRKRERHTIFLGRA
ncbi:MAG: MnmC family methyltransferase, partial [Vicinamibacterales bacterium]|nr:MnmC family methyltransferase [Vicinamibacterales bacterium]